MYTVTRVPEESADESNDADGVGVLETTRVFE